ncbi:MAG: MBL fold metallo-hydrolase [Pseudomonadota bacterium]
MFATHSHGWARRWAQGRVVGIVLAGALLVQPLMAPTASAQQSAPKIAPDRCLALAWNSRPAPAGRYVQKAAMRIANLQPYQVRVTFMGHATFLIESPKGVKVATDYAIPIQPPHTPDIVTMNNSHESHYTDTPQKEITHVVRGWNPNGGPALHDLTVQDIRVRNVPTNVRSWSGGTREYGNSIFIFEIGGLCIAHLGHLHHTLTTQQLANIGQMDVVMVPVDGSYTLDYPGMFEVLQAMKPRYIIPMHYFSRFTLDRFLSQARKTYKVTELAVPTTVISKDRLPANTEVLVLPGN